MVVKEFSCSDPECARAFEGLVPVCPYCGAKGERAFRTPPSINRGMSNSGSAKRIDKMLEKEFARQGISNFSNVGGENRITWARRVNSQFPGVYASDAGGMAQPPIRAYMGKANDFGSLRCPQYPQSSLANEYGFDPNTLSREGRPWNLRQADGRGGTASNQFYEPQQVDPENPEASAAALRQREPGLPQRLAERSEVLVDIRGDPEIPSGVDVNQPGWTPKNA